MAEETPKENPKPQEEAAAKSSAKPKAAEAKKADESSTGETASEKKPAKKSADKTGDASEKQAPPAEAPATAAAPTAKELLATDSGATKIIKAKGSKNIVSGIANIKATFNNTLVSITDMHGNVIGWSSGGKVGFKGSRKSTAFAAQQVAQDAARQAMSHGLKEIEVKVKGPGSGRESAIRALQGIGLDITTIKDVTPVPHNGCRPRKKRRV